MWVTIVTVNHIVIINFSTIISYGLDEALPSTHLQWLLNFLLI